MPKKLKPAAKKKRKKDDPELGISDQQMDELRALLLGQVGTMSSGDLPEGTRQILIVKQHCMFSADWLDSAASGKTSSASVLLLLGDPSPHSDQTLKGAYVTFVEDGKNVRQPSYDKARGIIRLELHHRNLPTTLMQLHEPNVYCWVGHFANGHIYGDVHTAH